MFVWDLKESAENLSSLDVMRMVCGVWLTEVLKEVLNECFVLRERVDLSLKRCEMEGETSPLYTPRGTLKLRRDLGIQALTPR